LGFGATIRLLGFGPTGWGASLVSGAAMTLAVSAAAYMVGLVLGALGAWGKVEGGAGARHLVDLYTTVLRGVPELLVIYLFYFGGSEVLTSVGHAFGGQGFIGLNGFMAGTLAVGVVAGAYQTEALRGGFLAIPRGELEAARAVGMGRLLMLRRIVAPRTLRFALPSMGNVWQQVLKESALISVTGLSELMRAVNIAGGSTRFPFDFAIAGFVLYLVLTTLSGGVLRGVEHAVAHGERGR
jgi:octopine/nopaline transport system permease protein